MSDTRYGLIRTVQVRNDNIPGVLGALASAIGRAGANIGAIQTVFVAQSFILRDIDISVDNQIHLDEVLDVIGSVSGVEIMEVRDEVLEAHRGGKIKIVSSVAVDSVAMLRKIYTPGVADVSRRIAAEPDQMGLYTIVPKLVAIITDGTAVLGLGNIGPKAAMPVMEGKAALLSELVGISGIPILLDTTDIAEIVKTVRMIAPTFGGIHLEDIAAPRCFEITDELKKALPIPVMHDDQDGTAAVMLGALLSACGSLTINLSDVVIGQIGLGAAGQAIADLLMFYSGKPVLGTDIEPSGIEQHIARGGIGGSLEEIMEKADVVVATTGVKGLIRPEQVRKGQIIMALSNPDPEIDPSVALDRGASIAADGRTVNNVLGYPGIWKGTLDSGASMITREMLISAGTALGRMSRPGQLLPGALDLDVHQTVANAVADRAVELGIGNNDKRSEE